MLNELVSKLADRKSQRTEADIQSDIQTLLCYGEFDLKESEVRLESQAGEGKRIDVEIGQTIIEVKKDLRKGTVLRKAEDQLTRYIVLRSTDFGEPYSGVLTDGKLWRLYHMGSDDLLKYTSQIEIDPRNPNTNALLVWLNGALATKQNIEPTPDEIQERLGAGSSAFCLEYSKLKQIYSTCSNNSEVMLKKELWTRLLTSVFGSKFVDSDELFIEHTYLVLVAKIIAHSVIGLDVSDNTSLESVITGQLFLKADIHGVIEKDFFDWVLEASEGELFLSRLSKRLSKFCWEKVNHDIFKVLYESIINRKTRHDLGEYYTPDWLAEHIVNSTIDCSTEQRVLDPACGSGSFLFHAVRKFLIEADNLGFSNTKSLELISNHVIGVDLHPVAVILARVTYLLAIGTDRLQDNRNSLTIPVYLGDSMQWESEKNLLTSSGISITTSDGLDLFDTQLRFPASVLENAGRFDQLVEELALKASSRSKGSAVPSIESTLKRYHVKQIDKSVIRETFKLLCHLFDDGRDHIWGYFIRNLARPYWLSRKGNQVDILIGNPPWLSYRFMSPTMQSKFKAMSIARGLWVGAQLTAHQDLSSFFVVRSVELYLKNDGKFSYVMPAGALTRQQYEGFRSGLWSATSNVMIQFSEPIDLRKVTCQPALFPVPCSIISGDRQSPVIPMGPTMEVWSAKLPQRNISSAEVKSLIERKSGIDIPNIRLLKSEYSSRFTQGAFVWPRVLLLVENDAPTPLGGQTGRRLVKSARSVQEKEPWKSIPSLFGSIEEDFVKPLRLGATIAPFRELNPEHAVIPWDGEKLLGQNINDLDEYPGLAKWWREAENVWTRNRPKYTKGNLINRLEYKNGTSKQFPLKSNRVIYTSSGSNLVATRLKDQKAVVSETLYWSACSSVEEACYLVSIFNSSVLLDKIKFLQSEGQFGRRHFHKVVFAVGIPLFNANSSLHQHLAELGLQAEKYVATIDLGLASYIKARKIVTKSLKSSNIMNQIDSAVKVLLEGGVNV